MLKQILSDILDGAYFIIPLLFSLWLLYLAFIYIPDFAKILVGFIVFLFFSFCVGAILRNLKAMH